MSLERELEQLLDTAQYLKIERRFSIASRAKRAAAIASTPR